MSDHAVAPIGLAQSLRRYPWNEETEISTPRDSTSRQPRDRPGSTTNVADPIPSRASTPLSECHRYATTVVRSRERFCAPEALLLSDQRLPTVPSEVLSPIAFSQPHGATDLQRVPNCAGPVAPPGFRTLSTLCSPNDLPGLFHPDPAVGVYPSRRCSPGGAVRPLGRRVPPDFRSSPALRAAPRPSRD
jgi:hypothetical protein